MESSKTEHALVEFQKFTYTPLPTASSIRLLEISLEKPDLEERDKSFGDECTEDILVCTLHTLDLDDRKTPTSYDALSYTWGNPFSVFRSEEDAAQSELIYATKLPIICNGMVIHVGRNLYQALLSLRMTRRSGGSLHILSPLLDSRPLVLPLVWIDAICINQEDLLERNAQVRIMHQIYRTAKMVHIWLGPMDDFTLTAIQVIGALAEAPPGSVERLKLSAELETSQYQELGILPIKPAHWQCLFAFLERRWFRRAWIIQEVALSNLSLVNAGSVYLLWTKLMFATGRLRGTIAIRTIWDRVSSKSSVLPIPMYHETKFASRLEILEINPATIIYMISSTSRSLGFIDPLVTYTKPPEQVSRLDVLARFRASQCQDPRDRVYAFLSLWSVVSKTDQSPKRLLVDYSRTVAQVYTDAAWVILESSQNLSILSHVTKSDGDSPRTPCLPSWVPDWSCGTSFYSLENLLRECSLTRTDDSEFGCPYRATEDRVWRASSSENPALLKVRGRKVGTVKALAEFDRLNLGVLLPVVLDMEPLYAYWKVSSAQGDKQASENPSAKSPSLFQYEQESDMPIKSHARIESLKTRSTYEQVFCSDKILHRRIEFERCFESLFEAIWRTLIADVWQNQYPAPVHAGLAFGDFIIEGMRQLLARFQSIIAGHEEEVRNILGTADHDRAVLTYLDSSSTSKVDLAKEWERSWRECVEALVFLSFWEELSIKMYTESFPNSTPPEKFVPHVQTTADISSYEFKGPKDGPVEWSRQLYKKKSLFSTSTGKIGSSSTATRTGDEIWILAGSDFPFILRPLQNGHYELISEVYVRGIMNGQAVWLEGNAGFTEIILE